MRGAERAGIDLDQWAASRWEMAGEANDGAFRLALQFECACNVPYVPASNQRRLGPAWAFAACELGLVHANLRREEAMTNLGRAADD
jgi:hypothetical protein